MMSRTSLTSCALAFLSLLAHTSAQNEPASASTTIGGGLAFAVNVPSNSTDALFVNFRLPARQTSWGAFGFGSGMSNAMMLVVYPNAANDGGITVSPRISTGYSMPQHDDSIKFTLFPDSGIINGSYVVRGMCENCRSWSGGSIDATSSNQPMLWGSGPAASTVGSDDLDARISVHQAKGRFAIDMSSASGTPGIPTFALTDTQGDSSDDDLPTGSGASTFFDKSPVIIAHALIMIFAFLVLFPGGYALLRLLDKVLLHAGVQSLAFLLVVIATGLGIAVSKSSQISPNINAPHQIIGLVTLVFCTLAIALGATGHAIYRRTAKPWKFMIAHRIAGPASMGLGLGNCITGFRFAGHNRPIIGFIVVAVIIYVGIAVLVLLKRRRGVRKGAMNTPAAMNFREGYPPGASGQTPHGHGPAIPLQSYQPAAHGYAPKVN